MATRIPPLLSPYLTIPSESSLLLLTGVLGASTNWLVLRYVYSLLQDTQPPVNILLVSFLRDITFWKDAASRIGLDLMAHGRAGRFIFGEGLTGGLFTDTTTTEPTGWMISMNTAVLGNVKTMLEESIEKLKTGGSRVVLIIDQIDLLLAAGGESISVKEVREMLLDLREVCFKFLSSSCLYLNHGIIWPTYSTDFTCMYHDSISR
jgi:elongator complex protein 6